MNLTFENIIVIYLIIINITSGIIFSYDKQLSKKKNKRRIPEINLHIFEFLGGVFANILLMYTLRHKNRKFSYYWFSWLVIIGWVFLLTQGKNIFS